MTNYQRLRGLLAELFQFDQADLDFGIYRIMNQKREEISHFLDEDLLPQVRQVLEEYQSSVFAAGQAELQEAIQQAQALGADPDTLPRIQELRARYGEPLDLDVVADEVFSHLYDFFRRYYHEGDFISLRRYREGVYAIPYEGEEVKLYWANHDQYYVKSTESFRNYSFRVPDGRIVHFRIVEAEVDRDNNKPAEDRQRRFILAEEDPIAVEEGELVIRFHYAPVENARTRQDTLNAQTAAAILSAPAAAQWSAALNTPQPTEANADRTLLDRHLAQYTARNTFDYFIHKDLGGFLRRELDFFIKNEIMRLDDIEQEDAPKVEQILGKIRALRRVATRIIAFLAQLEDFQKQLWLKKKFVVETNWCVTLDRVPEELYPEVLANEAQLQEWRELFAIDEIGEGLFANGQLDEDFLRENPFLVLDTAHFPRDFTDRLLASLDDLDDQTDGLLVHGENFQALMVLAPLYRSRVRCVYIDPPYNTGNDEFIYRDSYPHSSWLAMIHSRMLVTRDLMADVSGVFVSLDDNEQANMRLGVNDIFGPANFVTDIIWNARKSVSSDTLISQSHHHTLFFARDKAALDERKHQFRLPMTHGAFANPDSDPRGPWAMDPFDAPNIRPNLTYPITNPKTGEEHWPPDGRCWRVPREEFERLTADGRIIFGVTGNARPYLKRFLAEAEEKGKTPTTIWSDLPTTTEATKLLERMFGTKGMFSNPKPPELIERIGGLMTDGSGVVLDYFAGSGTTAHAVINLNREDGGNRKYILVEMGAYFDTVLLPRIKKVIYSDEWRDGKPTTRQGSSHLLKYIRLESYEDTLNNLVLRQSPEQQQALAMNPQVREEYMLGYMMEIETRGSASLLNLEAFRNPFSYTLNVASGIAGETRPVTVDLVETFNYLIGLRVRHMDVIRGVRVVVGSLGTGERGSGGNGDGSRVLVLWRDMDEIDNDALDEWFTKQGYNTRDQEYDLIYVNGDNNLENLRREDQTWKVRLIEHDFHRLMFEGTRERGSV